jgi:hypothetical protein
MFSYWVAYWVYKYHVHEGVIYGDKTEFSNTNTIAAHNAPQTTGA